ncbi:MAG: replication initiation protein [Peptostreptococcaceae bacterium]
MDINDKNILMKSNIIIKAKYNISTLENRVFLMLLYKLQKSNDDIIRCEISHEEFKSIIKKKQFSSIDSISNLLVNLRKQSIYFKDEEGWGEYGFINGFKYIKSRKTFKIEASKEIHLYIRNYLEIGYTPINLSIFFGLINPNSQRFYDLLRLWSGSKSTINYKIDELKELLMIEDKYDRYSDFKRRIIIPAIKELNDTEYFEIDFNENKVGRKVDSIDFIVKDLDKRKYFEKEVKNIENTILSNDKKRESGFETMKDIFIPDETLFTKGTLRSFKIDFQSVDFKNEYMKKAFDDSVMITFDRDDIETIKATSYKFFKGTLDNKIKEYINEELEDIKHKNNLELYWNYLE